MTRVCYKKWHNIKKSASRRGLWVIVNREEAYDIFVRQKGRCALSGRVITLATTNREWKDRQDNHASLDRIDSNKDYTRDNVQWVLKEVNVSKNNMTDEEYIEVCKAVVKHHGWRRFFRRNR